jgi:hypothetical protein
MREQGFRVESIQVTVGDRRDYDMRLEDRRINEVLRRAILSDENSVNVTAVKIRDARDSDARQTLW